jgi:putative iron-regulated protein
MNTSLTGSSLPSFLRPGSVLLLCVALVAAGCEDEKSSGDSEKAVLAQYVKVVRASYDDSIAGAEQLSEALQELVADPSQERLDAARQAWIAARPAYLQTEAYRFYEGPIDDAETGPEGRINGWPLDEVFIDYVLEDVATGALKYEGIINDSVSFPDITSDVLAEQNENGGEENIATGYHAIEFLLWGQDLDDNGPGARPYTDFVPSDEGPGADAERRGRYLLVASELLVSDLKSVRAAWDDGAPYTERFLANERHQSLKDIIKGIAFLANDELAAERIQPAYETRDQEDEHSCFSDTTHQDMINDVIGIQNVYFGRYGELDGPGLEDLVAAADSALNDQIKDELDAAQGAVEAMPVPFDQAIRDDASLPKVKAAIDALEALNRSLAKLTDALIP